jgi:hypothetical protein
VPCEGATRPRISPEYLLAPAPDYAAGGAAPIVAIGTTRDPATLCEWSKTLAPTLDSGVLLTRDGNGHTGFLQGNRCIDKSVVAYHVDGTVPAEGTEC